MKTLKPYKIPKNDLSRLSEKIHIGGNTEIAHSNTEMPKLSELFFFSRFFEKTYFCKKKYIYIYFLQMLETQRLL